MAIRAVATPKTRPMPPTYVSAMTSYPNDDARDRTDSSVRADPPRGLHDDVLAREQERFGGMKFGSAFFGWLTATGTAVLLTALVASIGAAVGIDTGAVDDATAAASSNPVLTAVVGAVLIGLVLLIAYFAGGYVAGRMARFSGVKQGIAVWIWASRSRSSLRSSARSLAASGTSSRTSRASRASR